MKTIVWAGATGVFILLTCVSAAIPARPAHSGRRSMVGAAFAVPYVGTPGADGFGGTVYRVRGGTSTTLQTGSAGELLGYAVL